VVQLVEALRYKAEEVLSLYLILISIYAHAFQASSLIHVLKTKLRKHTFPRLPHALPTLSSLFYCPNNNWLRRNLKRLGCVHNNGSYVKPWQRKHCYVMSRPIGRAYNKTNHLKTFKEEEMMNSILSLASIFVRSNLCIEELGHVEWLFSSETPSFETPGFTRAKTWRYIPEEMNLQQQVFQKLNSRELWACCKLSKHFFLHGDRQWNLSHSRAKYKLVFINFTQDCHNY
jgi:hypothetical protein